MHPVDLYKVFQNVHKKAYKRGGERASVEFQFPNDQKTNRFWYLGIALDADGYIEPADYIDISGDCRELLSKAPERFTFFLHFLTEEEYAQAIQAWGDIQSDTTIPASDSVVRLPYNSSMISAIIGKLQSV